MAQQFDFNGNAIGNDTSGFWYTHPDAGASLNSGSWNPQTYWDFLNQPGGSQQNETQQQFMNANASTLQPDGTMKVGPGQDKGSSLGDLIGGLKAVAPFVGAGLGLSSLGGLFSGINSTSGILGNLGSDAFSTGTGAFDMGGIGATGGAAGAGGAGTDYLTQMLGDGGSAGAGSGATGNGYNDFLKSIGIDPSSTQFGGGSMTNTDIMKQIAGGDFGGAATPFLQQVSKLLGGSGSPSDLATIGKLLGSGLGYLGSTNQANSLNSLAQQYLNLGQPSRDRFNASMSPGFDPTSIPGYQGALDTASKSILAKLSATGGNPYGNPGGLINANQQIVAGTALPAIQNYQSQNAADGGLANLATQAPALQTAAIGQNTNAFNSIGSGLSSITNPQMSLQDILKMLGTGSEFGSSLLKMLGTGSGFGSSSTPVLP